MSVKTATLDTRSACPSQDKRAYPIHSLANQPGALNCAFL
jgi:hypothetical protein